MSGEPRVTGAPRVALDAPPLEPLRDLLARLDRAGLRYGLGASGLLAALGLVAKVNDWDVQVDASIEDLERACTGLASARFGNDRVHADHKLSFDAERVELIAEFAFFARGPCGRDRGSGVVTIPFAVTGTWQGVPLASPTAWAAAYALMGELEDSARRRERADLLFGWLQRREPERAVIGALVAQPVPEDLAARLRALSP